MESIIKDLEALVDDEPIEFNSLMMDLTRRIGDMENRIRIVERNALEANLAYLKRFERLESHYNYNPSAYIIKSLSEIKGYCMDGKAFWIINFCNFPLLYRLLVETNYAPRGYIIFHLENGNIVVGLKGHIETVLPRCNLSRIQPNVAKFK